MTRRYTTTISFVLVSTVLWAQSDAAKATSENPGSAASVSSPPSSAGTQPRTPVLPDSTKLELVKGERAVYPLAAAEKQLQGQVWVRLHISETGDVNDVDVVSGDPILAQAAVSAAKKWKFKPYIKNGHSVSVLYKMPMDFAFRGNVIDTPVPAQVASPEPNTTPAATPPAGSADSPPGGNPAEKVKRVRVSQGVSQGLLLHKVQPIYPDDARRNRVQGTVLLQAVIDKNGRISDLEVISGPKELTAAAIGAVQQWRYRPYLLQGEAVQVQTQIVVNFQLR